jgi:SNF2 family DNA or RNA helicase
MTEAHEDAFFHQTEFSERNTTCKDGIVTLLVNSEKFCVLEMMYDLLLDHQRTALEWLLNQHTRGFGSILADEMGLGKTITTISLIFCLHLTLKKRGIDVGPILIVCPATLIN